MTISPSEPRGPAAYVLKAKIDRLEGALAEFARQKTMYGGKLIDTDDRVFLFASETDGGNGLVARGRVRAAAAVDRIPGVARQTPRVDVVIEIDAVAPRPLGRSTLKPFSDWGDGRPETELNFKLYRQATNKIVGVSEHAARFLDSHFG